ncbi:acyl-CoA carboxylase subunit epsilon [Streptomyces sp. NPDC057302]|uniref:acyl-CoA carboxylase subunit epsilon n=1 Tax=Streptomyces sp. NPDC057302 TaxID=3346094 RepID=UPI00363F319C
MGNPDSTQAVLRLERGQASDEELAALTVVLLSLHRDDAEPGHGQGRRPLNGSRWWKNPGYRAPRSWQ